MLDVALTTTLHSGQSVEERRLTSRFSMVLVWRVTKKVPGTRNQVLVEKQKNDLSQVRLCQWKRANNELNSTMIVNGIKHVFWPVGKVQQTTFPISYMLQWSDVQSTGHRSLCQVPHFISEVFLTKAIFQPIVPYSLVLREQTFIHSSSPEEGDTGELPFSTSILYSWTVEQLRIKCAVYGEGGESISLSTHLA